MKFDQLNEIINRIPVILILICYLGYLGYEYYLFQNDSESELLQKKALIENNKVENTKFQAKIKEAEIFYKTLDAKKIEIRNLATELGEMKESLSEDVDIAAFIKMVVTEAKRVGMSVLSIQPRGATKKEFYAEVAFELVFRGIYSQFLSFLENMSNVQKIIRVADFEIKPVGDGSGRYVILEGNLQILTYRYSGSKADEIASKSQTPAPAPAVGGGN